MHPALNLPPSDIKMKDGQIWDRLRKKYVNDDPEEWVRQNFINYLIDALGYSEGLMASEYTVEYNGMKKRCDIVLMNRDMRAVMIVECKAPKIKLTEDTFYQIAKYNHSLKAPLLIMTNGIDHHCALISNGEMNFLKSIPSSEEIKSLIG